MFSSRIFWTAVAGYLVIAAVAAWGFAKLAVFNTGTHGNADRTDPRGLIWEVAFVVAGAGIVLTWGILRTAAQRLSTLAETVAQNADAAPPEHRLATVRNVSRNLESAIDSMNRQLETRIEELQRKSGQLQESTNRLETVLGSMVEGVVAVDDRQRILFANPAARTLLDLHGSSEVGRPIWEVIRHTRIEEVIRGVLSGEDAPPVEIDLPRKHAVVAVLASRLPGKPRAGAVLVFHNVTELRRLENIRREFVSNVSHELKTPLTAIQAYAETLLDGAIDEPEHRRQFVERIAEQSNRLHALIQDLLRLARIESGEKVFEVQAVGVAPIVTECLGAQSAVAQAKGQQLSIENASSDIRILADEGGLHTIVSNLIDNAVKYTQKGGVVAVAWRREEGWGVIEVRDNGPGIAGEHLSRIFERFYRVDKARSRDIEGTGLGLSIVKHLVQEFGGAVNVHSQLGSGTTFIVRLPLAC
jgi:two-component system phosphate regulon sensor histidine kinase PhoR